MPDFFLLKFFGQAFLQKKLVELESKFLFFKVEVISNTAFC